MYRYKVPKKLHGNIRRILVRGFHRFRSILDEEEEGYWFFESYLDPEMFGYVYDRAYCEKEDRGILSLTLEEASDSMFTTCMMDITGQHGAEIRREMPPRDLSWEKRPDPEELIPRRKMLTQDFDLICPEYYAKMIANKNSE